MALHLKSCFKSELEKYYQLRIAAGVKPVSLDRYMNYFDAFILSRGVTAITFTKEDISKWYAFRSTECESSKYIRIVWSIGFLRFLKAEGFNVCIPRYPRYCGTNSKAYIYNEQEIEKYFEFIDSYVNYQDPMSSLYIPVIFRILYTCGTRIGETLSLKVKDVDLENGILYPCETKNQKKRAVPVSDSMHSLLKQYASKCLYLKTPDDYFFAHADRRKINQQSIYWCHRKALKYAGIKYIGGTDGPRLHDWRHTMAVSSLTSFEKNGADLTNVLPIMQRYLGHSNISATEKYLRLVPQHYNDVLDKMHGLDDDLSGGCAHENE